MPHAPIAPAINSPAEEVANAVTHGLGALAAAVVAVLLIVLASLTGEPWRIVTLSVFSATLLAVYFTSAMYHAARRPSVKRVLRKLDHAAIFLLIAGTYTPFMLVTLGGAWGWSNLPRCVDARGGGDVPQAGAVRPATDASRWGLKLVAGWLLCRGYRPDGRGPQRAGLRVAVPRRGGVQPSGSSFTSGTVSALNHAVWHVFVLAGSACHIVAIWTDVLPMG